MREICSVIGILLFVVAHPYVLPVLLNDMVPFVVVRLGGACFLRIEVVERAKAGEGEGGDERGRR